MFLNIPDNHNIENVKIENNILKGVDMDLIENPNIGELILDTLNKKPDHVAQIEVETDKKTIFGNMKDKSLRCGIWMENEGIGPGDIITICSYNHSDVYVPLFATFYVGAIVNGWDHDISLKSAQDLMKFFQPKMIFACESAADILLEAVKLEQTNTTIVVFGKHPSLQSLNDVLENQSSEKVQSFRPRKIEDQNTTGLIVLTSGSTSSPKGVMHSYKNVAIGIQVERLFAAPTIFNYLSKSDALTKYDLGSLKYVCIGGSKISGIVMEEIRRKLPEAEIVQVYGMSETTRYITSQGKSSKNLNTVGYPAPNAYIKIIDATNGNPLGVNQSGEICVKHCSIMLGYYKNEEETKRVIDSEGWLHVGDEGFYDSNGEITIVGRLKDMIKCQNFLISPSDLENVLLSHPAVLEVAVVAMPHDVDVEQPLAFVKKNFEVSEEELVNLTLALGEKRKLKGGVLFLDELPKLPTGKINKRQLKEMAVKVASERHSQSSNL